MKKKKELNPHKDFYWLSLFSLVLFFLVLIAFYRQSHPEWKKYQSRFKGYLEENVGREAASSVAISVKQIWLPELNRVDRCISCHLGYDRPDLVNAPPPFNSHPDIEPHPVSKMGCTICHWGQGFALKKKEAHGEIRHWTEPLLGKTMAKRYGFDGGNLLVQINCNICHRRDDDVPGMETINLAKKLLARKPRCQTCHIIDGMGGKTAPELTFVGDKPAERFDFSHLKDKLIENERPLSILNWHYKHFLNPKAVVLGSKMPDVGYSDREAWALAMLMMSWRNISLPVMLMPKRTAEAEVSAAEDIETVGLSDIERGKLLFESKECSGCHTIGKGVEGGPDLKGIMSKREAGWIRRMILNPEQMEQTDPLAKKLYYEFDELGMPNVEITEEEVEAIIMYIGSIK